MEEMDFFEGKRPAKQITFQLNNGKTILDFIISEEWLLIEPTPFTLKCNNKRELKLTQRFGFEKTDKEAFETNIGGTIGVKGIASIESSLKSSVGQEIKFQAGREVTDTFSFDSPECGFKVIKLYQKVRSIYVKYEDKRFWHRRAIEFPLTQWLKPVYDGSYRELYDPSCNCKQQKADVREGTPCRIIFPGFSKLAVFWNDTGQLEFAEGGKSLNEYFTVKSGKWTGEIPSTLLPKPLLFLLQLEEGLSLKAEVVQEDVFFSLQKETEVENISTFRVTETFGTEILSGSHQWRSQLEDPFNEVTA